MRAKIVIGLQFGDEGKGVTTDYLCSYKCIPKKTIVVRFCGGQQAGHTVTREDKSHIFSSFGSGTLEGCPTYISEYCTFYPPNIINELKALNKIGINPELYIHPHAICTTPYDVAFGRLREQLLKHGSCGIGVGATMKRQHQSPYKFYAVDLMYPFLMEEKLKAIKQYYLQEVSKLFGTERGQFLLMNMVKPEMIDFLTNMATLYMEHIIKNNLRDHSFLKNYDWVVFEGSQGIMLDMEHGVFPNVTYAHTTSKNAIQICKDLEINQDDTELYYVTRCYQTRHGKGWMSNEWQSTQVEGYKQIIQNPNETNVFNEWQKDFRLGEIDCRLLNYAVKCDSYSTGCDKNLVVTCLDQRPDFKFDYKAFDFHWWQRYENRSPLSQLQVVE